MLMRKLHTIFLIKTIFADNLSNTFFQFSINLNCLTKSLAKNVNVFEIAFYVCYTAAGVIRVLMVNYKTMSVIKNSALFLPIIITILFKISLVVFWSISNCWSNLNTRASQPDHCLVGEESPNRK